MKQDLVLVHGSWFLYPNPFDAELNFILGSENWILLKLGLWIWEGGSYIQKNISRMVDC